MVPDLPAHIVARIRELAEREMKDRFPWVSYAVFYAYSELLQEAALCRKIADVEIAYWYWDGIPWTWHRAVFTEILEHRESVIRYEASYLSFYGRN